MNTIIANSTPVVNQNSQLPSPSPPPSSNTSNTSTSNTPISTPSTTPTNAGSNQSVLERQLNSPLISQQVSPSTSPVSPAATNATAVVTLTPPPEKDIKEIKLDAKPATLIAQGKENIPLFGEQPIFAEKALVPPKSPEVIDLEMENDASRDKIVIPSFKKRKLEILREGGLEVTAVDLDARPSVIQATITPVTATSPLKSEEKINQSFSAPSTPNSVPKLISVTVTPDIGHMLPSPQEHHTVNNTQQQQQSRTTPTKQFTNNHNHNQPNSQINNNNSAVNNNNNSRVINVGSPNNASLLQLYANATNAVRSTTSPSPSENQRNYTPQTSSNERTAPPKVMQSRSIFAHNEKMVYGNPKDILTPPKYHQPMMQQPQHYSSTQGVVNPNPTGVGVLDLTQRQSERAYHRPNLEIVRVPVVPRPGLLNFDMKNNTPIKEKPQDDSLRKSTFPGYPGMLDSRTMASNNLEITLVNPKQRGQLSSPLQTHQSPLSPPVVRQHNNNIASPSPNSQPTHRRHQNGKYPSRSESLSPYTPRKPAQPQIIPNVPNLHLNNTAYSLRMGGIQQQPQHAYSEKRKTNGQSAREQHRSHRSSESDKLAILAHQQQQQQMQQHKLNAAQRQATESSRRHSMPNGIPSGFIPNMPQNSPGYLAQMPNSANKFLPMLDPLYYSAFYNGLFPPPMPPAAAPMISPEFSAYYKELLNSQQRLAMAGQHQPTVPTSK